MMHITEIAAAACYMLYLKKSVNLGGSCASQLSDLQAKHRVSLPESSEKESFTHIKTEAELLFPFLFSSPHLRGPM